MNRPMAEADSTRPYIRRSPFAGDLSRRPAAAWDAPRRFLVTLGPRDGSPLDLATLGVGFVLEVLEDALPACDPRPVARPAWGTDNTVFMDPVPFDGAGRTAVAVAQRNDPQADPGATLAGPGGDVCPVCGRPDPTGAYLEGVRDTKIALGLEEPDSDDGEIRS